MTSENHPRQPRDGVPVAVVTGAGTGLGRAMAQALARDGHAVAILGIPEEAVAETAKLIEQEGGTALAVTCDVTDEAAVRSAVAGIEAELGRIDLLVNNAGSNTAYGQVWEQDSAAWWHDVTVNLFGTFLCSSAVLPGMVARGSGRVIVIVSGTAAQRHPYNSAYSSSKAALVRFTDSLAAEAAPHGVSVFALSPGTVLTELGQSATHSAEGRKYLGDLVAKINWMPPDIAADAVVYLASGAADTLSGRWLNAVDDLPALVGQAEQIVALDVLQLRRVTLPTPVDGE
ncbi:SDR family NAD(P)-dependent oxidoreductase [Streptomyces sp. NPDC057137]|uniref:SDR family NAD(P)-dependent oxidoreductase n=1 Tax=Streptomyces sp. NPDC057137 TaxID=3346030 RepID=UPI003644AEF9